MFKISDCVKKIRDLNVEIDKDEEWIFQEERKFEERIAQRKGAIAKNRFYLSRMQEAPLSVPVQAIVKEAASTWGTTEEKLEVDVETDIYNWVSYQMLQTRQGEKILQGSHKISLIIKGPARQYFLVRGELSPTAVQLDGKTMLDHLVEKRGETCSYLVVDDYSKIMFTCKFKDIAAVGERGEIKYTGESQAIIGRAMVTFEKGLNSCDEDELGGK